MTLIQVHGEAFITIETAAECYQVEVRWVEEIARRGILGPAEEVQGSLAFPAAELDRLAAILRWHRHHELELGLVVSLVGD
jgi:hypothetical protein